MNVYVDGIFCHYFDTTTLYQLPTTTITMAGEVKRKISASSARSHTRKSKSNSSSTFSSGMHQFLNLFNQPS
ncbi:hypothetical protein Hanom_Chr06g00555811 [Helianthus anomalus]